MKKLFLPFLTVFALGFATSCSDDDDPAPDPGNEGEEIVKQGVLTENETWTADNIYILDGRVVVGEGVTLTIEAGTIIKGEEGQETLASALIVDQGGRLIANGTAERPIIFTSIQDNIQIGQTAGTNLTEDDFGLWGGVIILGRAPISVTGGNLTAQIEGIPANEPYGQYGGDDPDDNSGSLQFVSIRHGGITIGQDNEINGLTLGGVGAGTTISNIEVVGNQDDGIEWFGGTVNASNLLVWAQQDDGLDVDQAYSGTISNAVVIQGGSEPGFALELDGPEGETLPTTAPFTIENVTVIGNSESDIIADLRDGVLCNLNNILVHGVNANAWVRVNGADSQAELVNDRIAFSNWEVVLAEGATIDGLIAANDRVALPAASASKFTNNVTAITSADEASVGANLSVFSWTYAASKGAY
ncbi:hypothetical protein JHJ32_17485 [Parapedobacter sp. ISTM3]|uniref:Right handed beta helix region n=1 Tax=Parapedobacter luteus TaxID=623280 RepID=A0A1T5AHM1_9SPHI|nr:MULTISPECIES: hypothetical protein [Parapedobacter]MBK1441796.1 hypothetical protein [Parapedobacter sp. ISTM3]SKB34488.1 hypothetical protein SAMN05660226_00773 [Parapedobacter luteus]